MSGSWWTGMVAGYAIAMPFGAVATYLVALAARAGWRVGVAGALGIATTDGLYAAVASIFGVGLVAVIAPIASVLRIAAAICLLGVAAHTTVSGLRAFFQEQPPPVADALEPGRREALPSPTPGDSPSVVSEPGRGAGSVPEPGRGAGFGSSAGWRDAPSGNRGTPSMGGTYVRLVALTAVNPATVLYFATVVIGIQAGLDDGWLSRGEFVVGAFVASASWQLVLAAGGTMLGHALSGRRGRLVTALGSAAAMVALVGWMLVSG